MEDKAPLNSTEKTMDAVPDYQAILAAHDKPQAHFTQKTAVGEVKEMKLATKSCGSSQLAQQLSSQCLAIQLACLTASKTSSLECVVFCPCAQFRNPKRISWLEWLFLGVATVSMLGVLGLSIERLITFEKTFSNITFYNNSTNGTVPCSEWVCTTDFLFTVILIVNLGKISVVNICTDVIGAAD